MLALDDLVNEAHLVRQQVGAGAAELALGVAEPEFRGANLNGAGFGRGPTTGFGVRPRVAALDELVMWEVAHLRQGAVRGRPGEAEELDAGLPGANTLDSGEDRIEWVAVLQADDGSGLEAHAGASVVAGT